MRRAGMFLVLWCGACTKPDGDVKPTPVFDTPWEGMAATGEVSGECFTTVGADVQGAGWFLTDDDDVWGTEGCWVRVNSPAGAAHDVVSVVLAGRDGTDAWYTLELDISSTAWNVDDIALDGTDGTGVLSHVGKNGDVDPVAYVVGGWLDVSDAGVADDDDIELEFDNVDLAEVAR